MPIADNITPTNHTNQDDQTRANTPTWFDVIKVGVDTSLTGLGLTWDHFWGARQHRAPIRIEDPAYFKEPDGIFTLDYPFASIPVPEVGRYQLHNEIDDCIVCDKCAKICPVDCIDIEVIKSPEVIGLTSDGTAKRLYAERFDIDMAKCCFCGLCTTVCPTDCLTMGSEIDVATDTLSDLNKAYGNLSPAEAQVKKELYETYLLEKEAAKKAAFTEKPITGAKPWLKSTVTATSIAAAEGVEPPKARPAKPWAKATTPDNPPAETSTEPKAEPPAEPAKPKAVAKPWAKATTPDNPPAETSIDPAAETPAEPAKPKAVTKLWAKATTPDNPPAETSTEPKAEPLTDPAKPKAVAKPWAKATTPDNPPAETSIEPKAEPLTDPAKPKAVAKPWVKTNNNPPTTES